MSTVFHPSSGTLAAPAAMAAPPRAAVEIELPAKKERPEVDPAVLPTLMRLLTTRLASGERFVLTVERYEHWDESWKNRMYLGTLPLVNDAAGEGTLRWIGKGLDADGNRFKTKNGGSYIKLSLDTRQVGHAPAVEETGPDGKQVYRAIGFFLLFERQGTYVGEFHTGVPEFPVIRLHGVLVDKGPDPADPLSAHKKHVQLNLSAVPSSPFAPAAAAHYEPAPTALQVVVKGAPPPEARYDW